MSARGSMGVVGLACALWLIGVGASGTAHAGERFAIVIGANVGEADEPRLSFAERDAQKMAEVLTRLGGVDSEDLILLLSPDAGDVRRSLAALKGRIQAPMPPGGESGGPVLFIYYSGHADGQALHLRGTELPFADLKAAVRAIGADMSVFLVDACRSGGLVRLKGAVPAERFRIDAQDELSSEGLAIITSSAESEDAQESERLGGGVFTHHLVTGLLGAADASGDARVTLSEAYRYAYVQTLSATSTTAVVQHPTFAFDMQGQRELVLTHMGGDTGQGLLELVAAGHYVVFERFGAREVAAELDARPETELVLPPGPYLVRRRETARVFETERAVVAGAVTKVADGDFVQVPYRHAVRKGYGQAERRALSLGADLEVAGALLPSTDPFVLGAVTGQLDFADLALRLRFRYGRSGGENAHVSLSQGLMGLDVGLYKLFDIGRHGVGFGLRGGVDWLSQSFDSEGRAPAKNQVLGRFGPFLRVELALSGSVTLQIDVGDELYFLDVAHGAGASRTETRAAPTASLGFGVLLP
ncbi:MAG: caspase family protein [Myxococcota bacterium]